MAEKNDSNKEHEEILQLVSFKIGEEEFGADILKLKEINRMLQITSMPSIREFIEGVINLRGKVIPAIDLRIQLGMPNLPAK